MKLQHLTTIALLAAAVRATRCEDGYELQGGSCVLKHCRPEQCYDKIPTNAHATCLDNCCSWECDYGYTAGPKQDCCVPEHSPDYPTTTYPTPTVTSSPSPTGYPTSLPPTATNRPEQLRLSPHFEITDKPQDRRFYWTVDALPGAPDGFEREMWVVNGQVEGPLIEANQGDTVYIHVRNNLKNGTAIHWHGLAQNGSVWADGPNGVTQCPIPPNGGEFTYKFTLNREDQYGSYWWHAHRAATYAEGITGPLIIHSVNDPLKRGVDYDIDQILMVRDQFHTLSEIIVAGLRSPAGFNGSIAAPSPKSGLINGRGVYNCSAAPPDSTCTQQSPIELQFPPNKRIRLRIINMSTHSLFKVSVDQHELSVIEADDTPTIAASVHRVAVNVAQRYSAVFNTSNDRLGDAFWLRAQMNLACFGAPIYELDPQALAVIRVVGEGDTPTTELPSTPDWEDELGGACVDLDDSLLVPRIAIDAPINVDKRDAFNSSLFANDQGFRWTLNNVSFDAFTYNPLLFQLARGEALDPRVIANIVADRVQVHDIIINNIAGADHPFHMHLLKMFIVGRGTGSLNLEQAESITYNTTNPLRRDTLNVSPGTWVVVRVITDIVGVAAFHCHIAWHQAAGLFGAFVIQPSRIDFDQIPREAQALCDAGKIIPGENINTTEPARRLMRRRLELSSPIFPSFA